MLFPDLSGSQDIKHKTVFGKCYFCPNTDQYKELFDHVCRKIFSRNTTDRHVYK